MFSFGLETDNNHPWRSFYKHKMLMAKEKKITFVNHISFFENFKELKKETFNQRGLIEIVTEG